MPVTEITKFKLLSTAPAGFLESRELHEGFNILRKHSGHTVHMLLSGSHDIFLIESWAHLADHERFQKTQDHADTIELINGKMDVEWIRHMDVDLRNTSLLKDPGFRGNVAIVETPADVGTVVAEDYAVAKILDWVEKENSGLLIDWSKDQGHAKSFSNKAGTEWVCKITDI